MTVVAPVPFAFENTYATELPELGETSSAAHAPAPQLLVLNEPLASELGVDPAWLSGPEGVAVLVGNVTPADALPIAQAYSGHQFGGFSPRLGDGRALLVGEIHDTNGSRRDLHLKGSGRTPFSRGGDGKAAVGPMLREYVISEAMHALGIATTRSLAVVATGGVVAREAPLPGAVLARVASSHLRVGTFQYAATHGDAALVRRLADYAIARHYPEAVETANRYKAFFDAVVEAQASLVAKWMLVGFIHGVMNTDNMTISGETIDYGPCAFMDAYDPSTVFSSIDHSGRYAYGNQPHIAQWNLARLAETLLPLFHDDLDASVAIANGSLHRFTERYDDHWLRGMRAKLGLIDEDLDDRSLVEDLLELMHTSQADFTSAFRSLSSLLVGNAEPAASQFVDEPRFSAWASRWQQRVAAGPSDSHDVATAMDQVNPVYIPRNHLVDEALSAATIGDFDPFERLVDALAEPFRERPGLSAYAVAAPPGAGQFVTYCGT